MRKGGLGLERSSSSLTITRMARAPRTVVITVPASTSNLGSGFDTLGLALNLRTEIRLSIAAGKGVKIVSPIAVEDRVMAEAMAAEAARQFFKRAGKSGFGFQIALKGNVPVARGLGYSATARLGVVAGLNELTDAGWSRQELLELVTGLEGHPDNASPAIFGGFTVAGRVGERVCCLRFSVSPKLKLVTLIPPLKINTEKARRLLPESFSKMDAAHSLNRAALITAAFASQHYDGLRGLFDDRFHQPHREPLIPRLSRVIRAAEAAGAIGGFLSGSGSAIVCLTLATPRKVAFAMQKEWPDSEVRILVTENAGFEVAEPT